MQMKLQGDAQGSSGCCSSCRSSWRSTRRGGSTKPDRQPRATARPSPGRSTQSTSSWQTAGAAERERPWPALRGPPMALGNINGPSVLSGDRPVQRVHCRPPAAAAATADWPSCPSPLIAAAMAALTAKLVGGGYERPDADKELPLDVNYAKLPEWLVRRCCARLGVFAGLACRCRLPAIRDSRRARRACNQNIKQRCTPCTHTVSTATLLPLLCAGGSQAGAGRLEPQAAGHPSQSSRGM